jgi:hypothetical protein
VKPEQRDHNSRTEWKEGWSAAAAAVTTLVHCSQPAKATQHTAQD